MKILQVNSHYNKGGAGKIVKNIHEYLINKGYDSYVVYGRVKRINNKKIIYIGNRFLLLVDAFLSRMTGLNGYFSIMNTMKIKRVINKIEPDIIHLHVIHGYYLNFKILFKVIKEKNIPIVWTFHDNHAYTGNCGYYFECNKWQHDCGKCPFLKDYPKSYGLDFTKKMIRDKRKIAQIINPVICTPSEWIANDIRISIYWKSQVHVINNGIDTTNVFKLKDKQDMRTKYSIDSNLKVILAVAYDITNPRKGFKYILDLSKQIDNRYVLILIGLNDNLEFKDNNNVITIPFTKDQDMLSDYYSLADVFIMPSTAENYATVALESLASGTPVIAFNAGGTPEIVIQGSGALAVNGDSDDFVTKVFEILDGKITVKSRVDISNRIKANNSIDVMTNKYLEVYSNILNNKRIKE